MNSFKKISIATAAALAIMSVSATTSSATPLAVTVATVANATTPAAPVSVAVPANNQILAGTSVAIAATAVLGTSVSFTASSTVKLVTALHTSDAPRTVASGVSTVTLPGSGTTPVVVYAYTTSTSVGSVTVVNGSYSTIVYIAGTPGSAYNLGLSVPSATAVGTVPTIALTTTDVFGNAVSDTATVTLIGSTFANGSVSTVLTTAAATNASTGAVLGTVTAALATAVAGEITVVATGLASVTAVTGLAVPTKSVISKFTVSDLSGIIAGLRSDLAAEKSAHDATKATSAAAAKTATTAPASNILSMRLSFIARAFESFTKNYNIASVPYAVSPPSHPS
jgi:hypothetical protein